MSGIRCLSASVVAQQGGDPGTGIGLAVVKTLVEQMGGSVSVQDADGGGAVFVLALKTCAAPPAAQVPAH